jgi:hypothetical protein
MNDIISLRNFSPSANDYIRNEFTSILGPSFVDKIKESNAIIAGGSVLETYRSYLEERTPEISDIDIFVNMQYAYIIIDHLLDDDEEYNVRTEIKAGSQYSEKFLYENDILFFFRFGLRRIDKHVDLMIVRNGTPLRSVVDNFDLSFCKIWIESVVPENSELNTKCRKNNLYTALTKKGFLTQEYILGLVQKLNTITINRIKKYENRGFTTSYNTSSIDDVIVINTNPITTFNISSDQDKDRFIVHILNNALLQLYNTDLYLSIWTVIFENYRDPEISLNKVIEFSNRLDGMMNSFQSLYVSIINTLLHRKNWDPKFYEYINLFHDYIINLEDENAGITMLKNAVIPQINNVNRIVRGYITSGIFENLESRPVRVETEIARLDDI